MKRTRKRRSGLCSVGAIVTGGLAGCSGDDDGTSNQTDSRPETTSSGSGCGPGSTTFDSSFDVGNDVTVSGVVSDIDTSRQMLFVDDGTALGAVQLLGDAPSVEEFAVDDCITATGQTRSSVLVQEVEVAMVVQVFDTESVSTTEE